VRILLYMLKYGVNFASICHKGINQSCCYRSSYKHYRHYHAAYFCWKWFNLWAFMFRRSCKIKPGLLTFKDVDIIINKITIYNENNGKPPPSLFWPNAAVCSKNRCAGHRSCHKPGPEETPVERSGENPSRNSYRLVVEKRRFAQQKPYSFADDPGSPPID